MTAENPNGQEGYWIEGAPFRGLESSAVTGAETYWFEGAPSRYLFPTGTPPIINKGIMWALLIDF